MYMQCALKEHMGGSAVECALVRQATVIMSLDSAPAFLTTMEKTAAIVCASFMCLHGTRCMILIFLLIQIALELQTAPHWEERNVH